MNKKGKCLRNNIKTVVKEAILESELSFLEKFKFRFRYIISPIERLLLIADTHSKICDIGCGNGLFILLLAKILKKKNLYGIDIDHRAIEVGSAIINSQNEDKDNSIRLEVYDGITIPDRIAEYECVFLNDVFHHIPHDKQQKILTTLYSKMASGTVLVIKDIEKHHPFVWCNRIHDYVLSRSGGFEVASKDLRLQLKGIGFIEKQFWKKTILWYPHYCVIVSK